MCKTCEYIEYKTIITSNMAIYIGSVQIANAYIGSVQISKVYIGGVEITI